MCGSALSVKGGMVSVVKNYLNYKNWGDIKVDYIPTHIEKNKYWLILYFGLKYLYNVSSTNSEQCKLCVNGSLYIDARLLWKQAIGSNCP